MHLFQVGAGSGGMVVLDLLTRDPRITRVTLVEPDVYQPHNVHRHVFPPAAVGGLKAELAAAWVKDRRPDIAFEPLVADLTDPVMHPRFRELAAACDIGVCAADNEPAKFAFDALLRPVGKPWTLGEVLSGGIGGWIHRFTPGGPCYGCVASHLQRTVTEEPQGPPPDYANPDAPVAETRIPASKASIEVIAALHAVVTLDCLASGGRESPVPGEPGTSVTGLSSENHPVAHAPGSPGTDAGLTPPARLEADFTSLLYTLSRVPGVFDEPFRTHRFRIPKSAACLICAAVPAPASGEDLDVALDQALARLGHE